MRHTLAVGTLLLCIGIAAGQEKVSATAQDLVARLSHPRFAEREKAARAIELLGEPALEALRTALRSDDGEVRSRADVLIARIERQAANRKFLNAPTISLKFDNVPLRNAIADLNKKSGLNLHLDEKRVGNPMRSVSIDTGDVPLWVAVEKLLGAAGLTELDVSPYSSENALADLAMQQQQLKQQVRIWSSYSGPQVRNQPQGNRIVLIDGKPSGTSYSNSAVRVRALPRDFPGNTVTKGTGEIAFTLDVTPAPSLAWQGLVGIEIRKAVDENGQRLTQSHVGQDDMDPNGMYFDGPIAFQGRGGMVFRQAWAVNDFYYEPGMGSPGNPRHVPVSLMVRDRASRLLKELEGVVTARVLTPPQVLLQIDDILKASANATHRAGSTTVQVVETKVQPNGGVQVRVRMEMPSMMMNEFVQLGVRVRGRAMPFLQLEEGPAAGQGPPQFALHDADGKPFRMTQQNHMNSSDNGMVLTQEMQLSFMPGKGQKEAARLVLTGRRSVDLEIPFILKDVPLP